MFPSHPTLLNTQKSDMFSLADGMGWAPIIMARVLPLPSICMYGGMLHTLEQNTPCPWLEGDRRYILSADVAPFSVGPAWVPLNKGHLLKSPCHHDIMKKQLKYITYFHKPFTGNFYILIFTKFTFVFNALPCTPVLTLSPPCTMYIISPLSYSECVN